MSIWLHACVAAEGPVPSLLPVSQDYDFLLIQAAQVSGISPRSELLQAAMGRMVLGRHMLQLLEGLEREGEGEAERDRAAEAGQVIAVTACGLKPPKHLYASTGDSWPTGSSLARFGTRAAVHETQMRLAAHQMQMRVAAQSNTCLCFGAGVLVLV